MCRILSIFNNFAKNRFRLIFYKDFENDLLIWDENSKFANLI